jgi:hypothetical protein
MKILIWKESSRYFRMVVLTEVARFSRLVNKMSRLEVRRVRRKRGIVPTTRNGARGGGTLRAFEVSAHDIVFL